MERYAGIDVSLESSSVCIVDTTGRTIRVTFPRLFIQGALESGG